MPKPNARLTMRLTSVTSNRDPEHYMVLKIEDATSGLTVAQLELLGEDLMDLLGNRQVGGVDGMPAYLTEPENRAALGCHTFTTSHRFPLSHYNDDTVDRWAARNSRALDAASYRVIKNNTRMAVVTFTYYTNAALPTDRHRLQEERQATMDVAATSCAADK